MAHETKLSKELENQMAAVSKLRDEIRVKLHLAGMDVKDAFKTLEHEAEQLTRGLAATSKAALSDMADRLKKLSEQIGTKN